MKYKIFKSFIEKGDIQDLLDPVYSKEQLFRWNNIDDTLNRRGLRIDETEHFQDIHLKYYFKIAKIFNFQLPRVDPFLGILYSRIGQGGNIHPHRDRKFPYDTPSEFINFRFNLMLNRGEGQGYNPIIDDEEIEVNTCDAWCFPASTAVHRTEVITDSIDRIVIQYGFMLTIQEFDNISSGLMPSNNRWI